MAKKKWSAMQRADYHRARVNSPYVSENKKAYSRWWIDGFEDRHARENYSAVCSEIRASKGYVSKDYLICLYGYKNGTKAHIESKK